MSKSQNTKSEQQKDLCITSEQLTEQWKKGKLPEGWYWVKRVTWGECINMLYNWSDTFLDGDVPVDNEEITEVLAPVPSYEEWVAAYECQLMESELVTTLKELLKKANKFLKDYGFTFDGKDCAEAFKVHTKINEVLK